MSWRVVEDAHRVVRGQPPRCTAEEYMAAGSSPVLLIAARRAEAYDALTVYDREPNEMNRRIAADAMAGATFTRRPGETPVETFIRLLPSFPPRPVPVSALTLLASSAARHRRLGETLGQALDRLCKDDVALCWAHDVVCDR
ncbi:MAG: hypothetical protein AAF682_00130 [Planctomycetota bacterium]